MIPRPANCHPPQLKQVVRRRVTPKQQISQGITPKCFNCGVEHTPLWRRDTEGNVICNACGLYYKLHEKVRPVSMKRAPSAASSSSSSSSGQHTVCFNCGVDNTPLWRRDAEGHVICNACGLYFKLHNVARPISMKRTVIKRRRR
ncbi:glucocorticoid receptor-like (DNA-binding domain), partial [Martensiomyces pterosporus]